MPDKCNSMIRKKLLSEALPIASKSQNGLAPKLLMQYHLAPVMGNNVAGLWVLGEFVQTIGMMLVALGKMENDTSVDGCFLIRLYRHNNLRTVRAKVLNLGATSDISSFKVYAQGNTIAISRSTLWQNISIISSIPFVHDPQIIDGTEGFTEIAQISY